MIDNISTIPKTIFWIHLNFSSCASYSLLTVFNEICINSIVKACGSDFKYKIYTNKELRFVTHKHLNEVIEVEYIDQKFLQQIIDNGIGRYSEVYKLAHIADFLRYWYLYNHGGIYFDTDILLKRSISEYYNNDYDLIFTKEEANKLNCGCILAKPKNPIIAEIIQNYQSNYKPSKWTYNSMTIPLKLIRNNHVCNVHLIPYTTGLNFPNYKEMGWYLEEDKSKFTSMYDRTIGHHIMGSTVIEGQNLRKRAEYLHQMMNCNSLQKEFDFDNITYFDYLIMKVSGFKYAGI